MKLPKHITGPRKMQLFFLKILFFLRIHFHALFSGPFPFHLFLIFLQTFVPLSVFRIAPVVFQNAKPGEVLCQKTGRYFDS